MGRSPSLGFKPTIIYEFQHHQVALSDYLHEKYSVSQPTNFEINLISRCSEHAQITKKLPLLFYVSYYVAKAFTRKLFRVTPNLTLLSRLIQQTSSNSSASWSMCATVHMKSNKLENRTARSILWAGRFRARLFATLFTTASS